MITEIAHIEIKAGHEENFEAACAEAKGGIGFELHRSI
jgi:hypothetical protein